MSTNPDSNSTEIDQQMMTRRGVMKAGAAATATAVAIGAGAGSVGAVSGLDVDGDYVQAPFIKAAVTVANHESDFAPLDFTDDSGERDSLSNYGAEIAPRDEEDTPHNPITLMASAFDAEDYQAFPREETFENADGDEEAVTALDATHWTVDEANTAGSMTVEDDTSPADGPALHVSTSSQGSGDTAVATFDSSYVDITSGEDRKLFQLVFDANTVESGVVVTFRFIDEDGDVREAIIDPAGDTANDGTIATTTVESGVYQARLGDLPQTDNGDGTFNNLSEVEIEVAEANADLSIYGFNLERESEWVFGTEEFTNADDELDTQEITEPTGSFSITGLDTINEPLASAAIADVEYDIELVASKLPDDHVEYEWSEAERYDHPYRLQMVYNFEELTAYDLDWTLEGLYDEVLFPASRFVEAGLATGQSDMVELAEIDDDEVSLTDRTSAYGDASLDEEIELSTAIQPGDFDAIYMDILYTEDERSSAEDEAAAGPIDGESSGPLDYLFSLPGMAISAIVGYLGLSSLGFIGGSR
ncbi:hypothetical protein [Halodesulfurarchaeum formicicum]|nr:hypothetical protein [Halodesulfurarchaeum formicicum]